MAEREGVKKREERRERERERERKKGERGGGNVLKSVTFMN